MKKLIALILTLTLSFSLVPFSYAEEYTKEERGYDVTLQLINLFGITEKTEAQILEEALLNIAKEDEESLHKVLNAIAKTVDEYSVYYNEEEWQELSKSMSGSVCGIGVTAVVNDGCFEVVTVLDGGSAKQGGIVPGDRIIEADGVDITGDRAENASSYITGKEGTMVTLKVKRANGEIIELTLERRLVIVPSVVASTIDEKIGYILINSFTEHTHEEVEKEVIKLKEKNIDDLIIDLRYNGGGVMDSGIATAELFMEKGKTIISTKGKDSEQPTNYISEKDGYKFNLVLLTNEYTASAAEIFSCALIENGYAVSVGKTTFGKACAQGLYPLGIGGALRITVLNYYTPKGNFINKTGVEVTHNVDNTTYFLEEDELPKLSFSMKFNSGDVHEDVEKIETILYDLDYLTVKPDNKYDDNTKSAVLKFQQDAGLFPYGVCDMTTQSYLITKYSETEFLKDNQLEFAKKLLIKE
ncbi:MAG: PDZ domain-containing protein [Ruminococcaceae bacterium]|nr:PDZ domain-containing protein [Oscillospiraceae bacterium]